MNAFRKTLIAGCVAAASFAPAAHAEKFFGSSSISVLHSDQYQGFGPTEYEATYFTFENVTAHNWGGTFFFIDSDQGQGSAQDSDNVYGEFAPTLNGSWLTGSDLSYGPIKDVFLAGQYEFGGGTEVNNYMGGFGLAWNVPGFQYFNTAFYYVDNEQINDDLQMTVTWGAPFEVGPARFLIDGYIDWSTAEADHESEFQFTPQIKLDVSNFWGEPGVLYAGVEYQYWNNKFGLGDEVMDTQSSVSALVKFHF
ncbi:outer membrane protein OmpK [Marinobacter zhanjiangensis]|uniref:Ion channel protein Tsx n=1 Tax=Marinobacter zhanjiangensis TaxID=578215 RepID=A0ABQ3B2A0_9GAMM|nr:outer membrane protein OmpK [Marinobacter zhanjiangensis]GGY73285.1 ion channel protein Tsx [Marinobacter zhanjiangensis]